MNRRTALGLLAVAGLTGCSLEPIEWVEPTAEPPASMDPAVEVRSDFFVQTSDSGVKRLAEGLDVGLRVSTPHFDGVIDQIFTGERLGEQDAAQVRQNTAITAPQRHEFLAFTMQAGLPVFQADTDVTLGYQLRVGAAVIEVGPPFGRFIVSDTAGYEIPWVLFVLSVPKGEPVFLDITDQEQTVSVNLITGEPVDDEAWALTQGFRERSTISIDPLRATFSHGVTSLPGAEQEPDQSVFTLPMTANDRASILAPWLPARGWAVPGMQWLRLRFTIEPRFDNPLFRYEFSGADTFKYQDSSGLARQAVAPERLTTEDVELSTTLDVTFEVPTADPAGTLLCRPAGVLQALYVNNRVVPAEFIGEAPGISFGVEFAPAEF